MVTQLDERNVVGRKDHVCGLCVWTIPKGTEHYTQRNADGSEIWTWRAHLECWALLPAYFRSIGIASRFINESGMPDPYEFRAFLDSAGEVGGDD